MTVSLAFIFLVASSSFLEDTHCSSGAEEAAAGRGADSTGNHRASKQDIKKKYKYKVIENKQKFLNILLKK